VTNNYNENSSSSSSIGEGEREMQGKGKCACTAELVLSPSAVVKQDTSNNVTPCLFLTTWTESF
jgi:hypothetical protein